VTLSNDFGTAAAGMAAIVLMGACAAIRRGRRKSPAEVERLRRLEVNLCGRIGWGRILEQAEPLANGPTGPILLYAYEVAGVTYEAAQDVSALAEVASAAPYLSGQTTSVKFDPKHPTNSILACEAWCGIPDLVPNRNASVGHGEHSANPFPERT
jgi:hypothetical protein